MVLHIFQKITVHISHFPEENMGESETVLKVNGSVMSLHSAAVLKYLNLGTYAKKLSRLCIICLFVVSSQNVCKMNVADI